MPTARPSVLQNRGVIVKLIYRRSFLELAAAALPRPLFGQRLSLGSSTAELRVPAGMDREGKKHAIRPEFDNVQGPYPRYCRSPVRAGAVES
jgi:hypothetical protein